MLGWLDDDPRRSGRPFCDRPVLGTRSELPGLLGRLGGVRVAFIVAIGENRRRAVIFNQLRDDGYAFVSAVHPQAVVSASASLGRGVMICAAAVVNPGAIIGDNVIINTGATVDHDNRIGRDAHLSPGSHTGGHVEIGRGAHVGLGAVVLPDCRVGALSVIGAGAVVDRDLPGGVVAVGVPARIIRRWRP